MRVIVVKDSEQMGHRAADLVVAAMRGHHNPVLGLATGSTPIPLYRELIRRHREEGLDFSTCITFNLDEYVALGPDHEQSYRHFMDVNLFDHININKKNTHIPDCQTADFAELEAICEEYERRIEDVGGIDLQILGIGANGHIGFNEPGSSLGSLTRIKTLTRRTREDNARFFGTLEAVPTYAVTMGIGTILRARRVVLLASSGRKADAVAAALEGPVTSSCPASALQLHRYATYVIDEPAAGRLRFEGYEHY